MMATQQPRGVASRMLKGAGLIKDEDSKMRDLTKADRRKSNKKLVGHRQRSIDIYKASGGAGGLEQKMLASRVSANISNPFAVRGAALRPANLRTGKGAARLQAKPLDVWRELVQKRYNPEMKFLNLDRLLDDELLKKNRIAAPGQPGSTNKEYPVLFKLASQLKPPVETLSLASNNIQNGIQITSLAHYLPNLCNLSLADNKLRSWKDVDYLSTKNRRLSQLRELIFIGNPLRAAEIREGRGEEYRSGMTRRFAMLEVLDQEAITKIAFDGPAPASSSLPQQHTLPDAFLLNMAPSFITGVDGAVISSFLSRFFPLFDSQRVALADVYDPSATFSYSAFTQIPPRARIQGWHTSPAMPNQRKLEWGHWLHNPSGGSRNLHFLSGNTSQHGLQRELKSLHTGPDEIVKAMSLLPATSHEIAGAAEKFCIDAWPVGQGATTMLFLCVHGEFAEEPSEGIRSFDRSFVLAPAPPGSRAALNNWAIVILSDQLTVRPFSHPDAWKPGPLKVQGYEDNRSTQAVPRTPPRRHGRLPLDTHAHTPHMRHEPRYPETMEKMMSPEIQTTLGSIPDPQRSLVVQIMQRTKLNVKFAYDCLENNSWDIERAVANFEQVKASLGPEAYL